MNNYFRCSSKSPFLPRAKLLTDAVWGFFFSVIIRILYRQIIVLSLIWTLFLYQIIVIVFIYKPLFNEKPSF